MFKLNSITLIVRRHNLDCTVEILIDGRWKYKTPISPYVSWLEAATKFFTQSTIIMPHGSHLPSFCVENGISYYTVFCDVDRRSSL